MDIQIVIEPGKSLATFADFKKSRPPFSIAIDGYVKSGPQYDDDGPYRNFNHHDGVSRDDTLSTCAQVVVAIRKGLFTRFRDEQGPLAIVHLNDIDPDSSLSAIALKHHHLIAPTMNPIINRLVDMVHHLDMSGGLWPYPTELPSLELMNWIFAPYWDLRMSGELDKRDPHTFRGALKNVELRVLDAYAGGGEQLPLQTKYRKIGGGMGWTMVIEEGGQARLKMLADGIHAFVSCRTRPDGRFVYTLCRYSDYIPFPIPFLCAWLNREESGDNRFGGGNNIIGNSYGEGSLRAPDTIEREVNAAIAEYEAMRK